MNHGTDNRWNGCAKRRKWGRGQGPEDRSQAGPRATTARLPANAVEPGRSGGWLGPRAARTEFDPVGGWQTAGSLQRASAGPLNGDVPSAQRHRGDLRQLRDRHLNDVDEAEFVICRLGAAADGELSVAYRAFHHKPSPIGARQGRGLSGRQHSLDVELERAVRRGRIRRPSPCQKCQKPCELCRFRANPGEVSPPGMRRRPEAASPPRRKRQR